MGYECMLRAADVLVGDDSYGHVILTLNFEPSKKASCRLDKLKAPHIDIEVQGQAEKSSANGPNFMTSCHKTSKQFVCVFM